MIHQVCTKVGQTLKGSPANNSFNFFNFRPLVTRRSCIIDVSAAVFNEESTEEPKTEHESTSFDTGTVSVIEEEEPTDLECSESLMTIKSYRDTQKKVKKYSN